MGDYISEMTGDELQRNLRDAYGMTSALNREIEMLNSVRAKQAARIDDLEKLTGMMEQIRLHDEHTKALTAENAKLREQLAEAVMALKQIAGVTMSMVVNVQHLADERGRIARAYLAQHEDTDNDD